MIKVGEWPPLQELFGDIKRFYDFAITVLKNKSKKNSLMPHYHIIKAFTRSLIEDTPLSVSVLDVIPTMNLLEELKKLAGIEVSL